MENTKNTIKVTMGPMNAPFEDHPCTIIATCELLGTPLPYYAICKNQPSKYILGGVLTGKLSDIKKRLGSRMPLMDADELKKVRRLFRRKYKSQENLKFTKTDLTVYFCDWLLFARGRGFSYNDYFDFEFYNKEPEVRDTFLSEGYRERLFKACANKEYRKIFAQKTLFNEKFSKYVKRDWLDARKCTFEEFQIFIEKHEEFFGKPIVGSSGIGARTIRRDEGSPENLYEMCKNNKLILEELIVQHDEIAEFNSSTLNTVRVNTLLCADGVPRIVLTVARFGRSGNCVDNFHNGGVGAIVDIETGKIITEAINRSHIRTKVHPDSKKEFLGFQYPEWDRIKKAVCEAALMIPEVRNVGWDVAVTKDGNIEFVEGNCKPSFDVLQSPDQLGRRFRYEPYLPDLEALKGIETEEIEPLVVHTKQPVVRKIKRKARKITRKIKRKIGK